MAIAEDPSTPAVLHQTGIASGGPATTVSFSPPGNSLVLVLVVWMWPAGTVTGGPLSCRDSLGNVYAGPVHADWARTGGRGSFSTGTSSAIFTRYYASAPGAITLTVTSGGLTPSGASSALVAPRVLTGAASNQTFAGQARSLTSGDIAIDMVTTGSVAYCCGGRPGVQGVPVAGANTIAIDTFLDTSSGNTAAAGKMTGINTHPGVHRVGWIKHVSSLAVLEVLPAALTLPPPQPAMTPFEVMTARLMNDWLTPDNAVKNAATSITSNTALQPDPDLTVPVAANAYYTWRCVLLTSGPTAASISLAFTHPGGSQSGYFLASRASGTWNLFPVIPATVVSNIDTVLTNPLLPAELDGWLYTGGAGGSFTLTWAQQTSNATASQLLAGSYLTLWREGLWRSPATSPASCC